MFSPPSTRAVEEKIHVLVSLPILSNQERELQKEAVLSPRGCTESRILQFAALSRDYHCWVRSEVSTQFVGLQSSLQLLSYNLIPQK